MMYEIYGTSETNIKGVLKKFLNRVQFQKGSMFWDLYLLLKRNLLGVCYQEFIALIMVILNQKLE